MSDLRKKQKRHPRFSKLAEIQILTLSLKAIIFLEVSTIEIPRYARQFKL